jgi:hypothetical protein
MYKTLFNEWIKYDSTHGKMNESGTALNVKFIIFS